MITSVRKYHDNCKLPRVLKVALIFWVKTTIKCNHPETFSTCQNADGNLFWSFVLVWLVKIKCKIENGEDAACESLK